ncbi:V-type proton ATPase subunit S1-like [Sycon ciliatum]|uniref:V-type proton ATPase subunit S1-like n=1 Tax=Sycon ciliatum TaxID=27933 RepID=UPI0031F67FBF
MARGQTLLLAAAIACLWAARIAHGAVQPVVVSSSLDLQLDYRSGKGVSAEELVARLPREKSHVFTFVAIDDLKLQDFSLFGDAYDGEKSSGGVFSNLKSMLDDSRSQAVVPSVTTLTSTSLSESLESYLAEHGDVSVQSVDARSEDDLATLEHTEGTSSLWIVHVPSSSEQLDRMAYLKRCDTLVGALRSRLPTDHHTLLLSSSHDTAAVDESVHAPARHLLAAETVAAAADTDEEQRVIFAYYCANAVNGSVPPDVLLSFTHIQLNFRRLNTTLNFTSAVPENQLIGCDDEKLQSTSVTALVTASDGGLSATLHFVFSKTNGRLSNKTARSANNSFYWELSVIRVQMAGQPVDDTLPCYIPQHEVDWVIAPQRFSFSCQPKRQWEQVLSNGTYWRTRQYANSLEALNRTGCGNASSLEADLHIAGLQIQAFTLETKPGHNITFSAPIDCVGYFTGQTWMGIIVAIFLFFVLFMASIIFISMETPDRFDDPKGRNIQVEK